MRILYVHQFYPGPEAPGPRQPRDLVRCLAERGHFVDVLACDLNAYNEQTEPEETVALPGGGGIRVRRLPVPRGLRASLANRLKTYGRFAWSAHGLGRRLAPPDVVLATIQPLFGGAAALRLARRWRRPFLLEVRDLNAWYGGSHVLQSADLSIAPGESVALLGRNGAGKSTLMKSLLDAGPRVAGSVRFGGRDMAALATEARARQGLILVPEDFEALRKAIVERDRLHAPPAATKFASPQP